MSGCQGGRDGWVVKLDAAGNPLWQLCLGGSSEENPGNIGLTEDGNFIVSSATMSRDGDITSNHGMYDLWIVKHGAGTPVHPLKMTVVVNDSASAAPIPGSFIGLYDPAHHEWQNVTASTGSITFLGSGASNQYALVPGTTYRLAASADGYLPAVRDVTFGQDGQRETVELTKVVVVPEVFTYSMTNVEQYFVTSENLAVPSINYYPGTGIHENISRILNNEGWQSSYYHFDQNVTKDDFGVEGRGLDNATFHYHFGHGNASQALTFWRYQFQFSGNASQPWPDQPYVKYSIHYSELDKKWGNKNKWVLIDACSVLMNANWGRALNTSHAILGFASTKNPSQDMPNLFFQHALVENQTVLESYKRATYESFTKNVTAAAIFDNDYQRDHDHFPGHGEVAPDESPDDSNVTYQTWQCGGGIADDAFYN